MVPAHAAHSHTKNSPTTADELQTHNHEHEQTQDSPEPVYCRVTTELKTSAKHAYFQLHAPAAQ